MKINIMSKGTDIENEQDLESDQDENLEICLVIYHQVYNLTNLTNIQNQKTPIV